MAALDPTGISRTVRRTRGQLLVFSDQGANQELQSGAFGAIVVNDLALAAGVASIPGPVTDESDDGWFVWQPFGTLSAASGTGGNTIPVPALNFEYDSKAMRKVEEGFGIAFMVENSSATLGLQIWDSFSMLSSIS